MRYIVITWDAVPMPVEAFIPCCFYHSAYAFFDFLLVEESVPYETDFSMPSPNVIPILGQC